MTISAREPLWRRASKCGTNTCVEVARLEGRYLVRDSKDPGAATLSFSPEEWEAFVTAVKNDEF